MTVINNSLARGLVRERMRNSLAEFERGRRNTQLKGRFGAQVRALRADLRSLYPVLLDSTVESGRWTGAVLVDNPATGDHFVQAFLLDKRKPATTSDIALGVTRHCVERMLQQAIPMTDAVAILRTLLAHTGVGMSGWVATATALWRVNGGMLATVIESTRLIEKRRLWERLREGRTDTEAGVEAEPMPMGCAA